MIAGTGIDMVEIARIQHAMDRYGKRFLDRVYLEAEQAYCLRKRKSAESFAARFAAKEAAAKALGTGISYGVSWLEIEVVRAPSGRPEPPLSWPRRANCRPPGRRAFRAFPDPYCDIAMASVVLEAPVNPPILLCSRAGMLLVM